MVRYLMVVMGVFAFFSVLCGIRLLRRRTCFFGHREKRFLSMDYNGAKNAQGVFIPRCMCFSNNGSPTDRYRFRMRWFCDGCNEMGEHCWDKTGEWKLEHGKIVPDEKRWANRA
jgi:hypothetical protein